MHNTRTIVSTLALPAAIVMALAVLPAQGGIIQAFDSGAEGFQVWTVNNGGGQSQLGPQWHATGGNGGGYISAAIGNMCDRLYDMQPSSAAGYGDLTGLVLTDDTMLDGLVTGPGAPMVRFYVGSWTGGSNYFVSRDAFSWNPNMDQSWVSHQVSLLSQNFVRWPNGDAQSRSFQQVIAHPDDIGLVFTGGCGQFGNNGCLGFSSAQGATFRLDNFGAVPASATGVPEPGAACLLCLGSLAMTARRKK